MYYALTINTEHVITGVHESTSQITQNMFVSNPDYANDTVVVIESPAEYESNADIRNYNEDGTLKPLLWRIENGLTPIPPDKDFINGVLVDKEISAEQTPQTIQEYLDSQFASIRNEAYKNVEELKEETRFKTLSMRPLLTELIKGKPADVVIQSSEFILPWVEGKYILDDVRLWEGQPKRCCQAHDSTVNPLYNPSVTSMWAPYHGTTALTALPWTAPTGAHDMYKAGEYMVFIDARIYCCLLDTAYSPVEYAQAWKAVNEASKEGVGT